MGSYETWFKSLGRLDDPEAPHPVLIVHGGPGLTHDYLSGLERLYFDTGRPLIWYDQVGSGRSTHFRAKRGDASFWTVGLFLRQMQGVVSSLLQHRPFHVLGHSWGGMLALEYALTQPQNLLSMILSSTTSSMGAWMKGIAELRRNLPLSVKLALDVHEASGSTASEEYLVAARFFQDRHGCRLQPTPAPLAATRAALASDTTVYETMVGLNDFHVTGALRDWTVEDRLSRIDCPALVVRGEHDEATDVAVRALTTQLKDVQYRIIENASHHPALEVPATYMDLVQQYLSALEDPEMAKPSRWMSSAIRVVSPVQRSLAAEGARPSRPQCDCAPE